MLDFIRNLKVIILNFKLRIKGAKIHKSVRIYGKFYLKGAKSNLSIDKFSTINEGVVLNCKGKITIGKNVHLSSHCKIFTTGLTLEKIPRSHITKEVIIQDNVWIGAGSIITKGVNIGENSVVGANSVVTRDIPSNELHIGNPAVFIKKLQIS